MTNWFKLNHNDFHFYLLSFFLSQKSTFYVFFIFSSHRMIQTKVKYIVIRLFCRVHPYLVDLWLISLVEQIVWRRGHERKSYHWHTFSLIFFLFEMNGERKKDLFVVGQRSTPRYSWNIKSKSNLLLDTLFCCCCKVWQPQKWMKMKYLRWSLLVCIWKCMRFTKVALHFPNKKLHFI